MSFRWEGSSTGEINELSENQNNRESLLETEETEALEEDFEDCRKRSKEIVSVEKSEEIEEDFEDCRKKSLEFREVQIQRRTEAVEASQATLEKVKKIQERYDASFYERRPDKRELADIREEGSSLIKELSSEKAELELALNANKKEKAEYVLANNMRQYETDHDVYCQKLTEEYRRIEENYDKVNYSIVKLDENNRSIAEVLGDNYVPIAESTLESGIEEVNQGTDIPGETNYFIDETKAKEVLSEFQQERWEKLTVEEQKEAIEKLGDYNAEILGVEEKPSIIYYEKRDPSAFGGFSERENAIYINEYNMGNASETADTISHEYRHCYQHMRAEKLENERDFAFKEGFENYIRPEDDYAGYKEQLVEADAREYAENIQIKIDEYSQLGQHDTYVENDRKPVFFTFEEMNPERGAVFDNVEERMEQENEMHKEVEK